MKYFLLSLLAVTLSLSAYAVAKIGPITGTLTVRQGGITILSDTTKGGTWTSSAPSTASVGFSGIVTGLYPGTAAIHYTVGTMDTSVIVTVTDTSGISGSRTLCQGSTSTLSDTAKGGTWSSSAPLIAGISATGIVSGVYPGTAIITYASGTKKAMITVTVNATAPIIGTTNVCAGSVTVLSDGIFGGTWSTKDPTIATITPAVSNVSVTGIAAGADTIFYTLPSGCVRYAVVNVIALPDTISGSSSVCLGDNTLLSDATANGAWSSSLPAVATIGITSGLATGVAAGTAIISYTALTGCTRTTTLTVSALPSPITGVMHTVTGHQTTLADATAGGVWSVNFPGIATMDPATGVVTGVSSGVATVFYKLTGTTGCSISIHYIVNGFPDSTGGTSSPIVGWYPFCGDFKDHSATGSSPANDLLTPPGTTTPPTDTVDRFGIHNSAYYYDALTPGNPDALKHAFYPTSTSSGDFAYSCWVKYDNTISSTPQASVIMHNGFPTIDGIGFGVNDGLAQTNPGGLVSVVLGGVGVFLSTDPYDVSVAPYYGLHTVNGWAHLFLKKEGGDLIFYVNNIEVGKVDLNQYPFNPPSPLSFFQVGADLNNVDKKFTGFIDDISLFNTALDDSMQRTSLYIFNPDTTAFSLGNDTTICSDKITLYSNTPIIGRIYAWSTGDTLHDTITVIPPAFTTTSYRLNVSQPYGCTSTDVINVTKKPLVVNIGVDTSICTGDTIILRARPHYGSATYAWNTGSTADSIKVLSTGNYMVTVDSGVCSGHDSAYVIAQKTPIVDLGPDLFNCNGLPTTIHNSYKSYDSGFTYLWSNGSNLDSLNVSATGSFWVQVTNKGCSKADSIKVNIVTDTFTFFSHDTAICQGRFVTGLATSNPLVSYQWTPTTGVPLSTLPSTTITPDTTATYYLTGSYPGCPDVVYSFHIDVQPYPKVFIGGNRNVCKFDTININAQVTPNWYPDYRYSWSPGQFLDDSTAQTVIFKAGDSTDLKLTVTTSAGCVGSDSALIIVHPGNFDSSIADITVCPGDVVQLIPNMYYASTQEGVTATYLWQPGKYVSDSTANAPFLRAVTSEKFTAIGTSQYGCLDTFRFNVIVNPGAVMYLGDSVVLHPGETYQVNNQTNGDYFHWFPTTGVSDTNASNPILSPLVSTTYIVHAETEAGCKVVDSFNIRIDPGTLIDIPNAFTPGASSNNKFSVIMKGLATISYFRIYNRWGNVMFETKNIADGWDGKFNGKEQPFGVYMYEIEAIATDGKRFQKHGNVTLLR